MPTLRNPARHKQSMIPGDLPSDQGWCKVVGSGLILASLRVLLAFRPTAYYHHHRLMALAMLVVLAIR